VHPPALVCIRSTPIAVLVAINLKLHFNLPSSPVCGIATSIAIGYIPQFSEFQRFKVVVIIWLVAAAFGDVIITFSLVRHLVSLFSTFNFSELTLLFICLQRKHKTGFSVTDDILNRIIRRMLSFFPSLTTHLTDFICWLLVQSPCKRGCVLRYGP
jgi:hypothetical protein